MLLQRLCNAVAKTVQCCWGDLQYYREDCAMLSWRLGNIAGETVQCSLGDGAMLSGRLWNATGEAVQYFQEDCSAARETVQYRRGECAILPW